MRRTFKINAVENITSNYNFVPRMSNIPTDASHILEGNMVYKITFAIGWIVCPTADQSKYERVERTYMANVELQNAGDHYLSTTRGIKTPRDFETTDTTKPMRWLTGREVNMLREEVKLVSKFGKAIAKTTGFDIHPWS